MCYTKVCLTGAELKTQLASVMTFVLKFFNYRPTSHQVWRTSPLIFEFTWGEMRRTQSECYARKVAFVVFLVTTDFCVGDRWIWFVMWGNLQWGNLVLSLLKRSIYCKSTIYFCRHNNIMIYLLNFNITYIIILATCFDSYESSSGINFKNYCTYFFTFLCLTVFVLVRQKTVKQYVQ